MLPPAKKTEVLCSLWGKKYSTAKRDTQERPGIDDGGKVGGSLQLVDGGELLRVLLAQLLLLKRRI